jgi:hypothetical protein
MAPKQAMRMTYAAALKIWNEHKRNIDPAHVYAMPRKGTPEHAEVQEIRKTGKVPEQAAMAPKVRSRSPSPERPRAPVPRPSTVLLMGKPMPEEPKRVELVPVVVPEPVKKEKQVAREAAGGGVSSETLRNMSFDIDNWLEEMGGAFGIGMPSGSA